VDDVAIALEHVDLLDGLDGLDVELLERLLELLVVAGGPRGRALHLSPGSTLATVRRKHLSEYRSTGGEAVSAESCLDIPCRRGGLVGRSESGEELREGQQATSNLPMRAEAPSFLSRS